MSKKLPVMEIFGPTIQGEGAMIGIQTTFIRFGLCDYKCTMCDSMHAVDPAQVKANAQWLLPIEIIPLLEPHHSSGCEWVTLSGGNPAIHDLSNLVLDVQDVLRVKVAVETQGTLMPEWLHFCDNITVSPKSPGMGEKFEPALFERFLMNFKYHQGFNVKVVVFSMADIEWAKQINYAMLEEGLGDKMYISLGNPYPPGNPNEPITNELRIKLLDEYALMVQDLIDSKMPNVKFLPQLHVLAWGNKQGV